MKILHTVEYYHPSIGGMQEVVKRLSEGMAARGHEVVVATNTIPRSEFLVNGVKIEPFSIDGLRLEGIKGSPEEIARYRAFLMQPWDVVVSWGSQQWATDLAYDLLPAIRARKVFVPTGIHGLNGFCENPLFRWPDLLLRRIRHPLVYWTRFKHYRSIATAMHHYDAIVFLSHTFRDIRFARRHGLSPKCHVIPNGASAVEFDAIPRPDVFPGKKVILHVGGHTRCKGHSEMLEIYARSQVRDTVLWLIGNEPVPKTCRVECCNEAARLNASPEFKALGKFVFMDTPDRAGTVAAYQRADMFLFPSNLEASPIVLFECMASRTPFLVTDVGNAREIIEWSGAGYLLPTRRRRDGLVHALIDPSVRILDAMLCDDEGRRRMADAGHSAWRERFTWEAILARYLDLYEESKTS